MDNNDDGKVALGVFNFVRNPDKPEEILWVRDSYAKKKFSLPGGGVKKQGELVTNTAIRELTEETGLCGFIGGLIGIFANRKFLGQVILFETIIESGILKPDGREIIECRFARIQDLGVDEIYLPQLTLAKIGLAYRRGDRP